MRQIKFWILLSLIVFAHGLLPAQTKSLSSYSFVKLKADSVSNATYLSDFYSKLEKLEQDKSGVLNIVHIGDSHIQADFLTSEIRQLFQRDFGNAGRGLVFPLRVAKTNGAMDARSSSTNLWKKVFVRSLNRSSEPGLSGVSIRRADGSKAAIDINTKDHDGLDYSFDEMDLICRNDSAPFDLTVSDEANGISKTIQIGQDTLYHIKLGKLTHHVNISYDADALLDGFVLKNGNAGVAYHVIGVNGAHFADYNKSPVFYQELPVLNPDLVIISLGTNEAVSYRATKDMMKKEVEKTLTVLRLNHIYAPVLLLIPFDNYYRRKSFNRYMRTVNAGLIEAAHEYGLPYVDAYGITGGYGSAAQWRRLGMLRPDRIHYMAAGYQLQAKLIYQGIMNSYQKYKTTNSAN